MNPWPEIKRLLTEAGRVARERRWWLVGAVAVVLVGVVLMLPHDRPWNRRLVHEPLKPMARQLSFWGDFPVGILAVGVALWAAGWWRRQPRWRTVALAALLASAVAGALACTIRFGTGRPRPNTKVPDRLHGPSFDRDYASFPSAHTATAFGMAGALVVALPGVGVPAVVGAGAVGWSRLCLGVHFPSDVWAGAWLGLLNGLVFAAAARRLMRPVVQP